MQPLDVGFMKPLSDYYTEEVAAWKQAGHGVTMKDVFSLFKKAFLRAKKVETAENAIAKVGICPFDSAVFPDLMFVKLQDSTT